MFMRLQKFTSSRLFVSLDIIHIVENASCKQSVRWRKGVKPKWLPIAKSKMFRVPKRPIVPLEESVEIQRLTSNHNTYMKSISAFLREFNQSAVSKESLADASNVEDDLIKCKEINNKWNAKVAIIREQRLLREREERINLISQTLEEEAIKHKEFIATVEKQVRNEKEKEKYLITPENIDEAIENALRSEVDYNFAIDMKGNIYKEASGQNQELQGASV